MIFLIRMEALLLPRPSWETERRHDSGKLCNTIHFNGNEKTVKASHPPSWKRQKSGTFDHMEIFIFRWMSFRATCSAKTKDPALRISKRIP
jgi:hypothetical protein